jgi:phenylalanyl-tRNA synthetase beta chain
VVIIDRSPVAKLGRVETGLLGQLDIDREVFFAEIDFSVLETRDEKDSKFEPLPRFREIERDMALLIDASYACAEVTGFVSAEAGMQCKSVDVFDSFTGDPLPAGKRNLGLRLRFLPREKNMSSQEVDIIMTKLAEKLTAKFGAVRRGREGNAG